MGPARIINNARLKFVKLKSLLFVLTIKYNATTTIGNINKLSISKPISVSTWIFFLKRLYELQKKAIPKPAQGIELIFNNKYELEIITKTIEIFNYISSIIGYKKPPIFLDKREGDIFGIEIDNSKSKSIGWLPKYNLKSGLENTVKFLKEKWAN